MGVLQGQQIACMPHACLLIIAELSDPIVLVRHRTELLCWRPAGAKFGWNTAWQTMMNELAPHTKDGSYARPTYTFSSEIGTAQFPVSACSRFCGCHHYAALGASACAHSAAWCCLVRPAQGCML